MERALRLGGRTALAVAGLFFLRELLLDSAAAERDRLRKWYIVRRDAVTWSGENDEADILADDDAAIRAHLERLTAYKMPLVIPRNEVAVTSTSSETLRQETR